jgi:hypothetical protein
MNCRKLILVLSVSLFSFVVVGFLLLMQSNAISGTDGDNTISTALVILMVMPLVLCTICLVIYTKYIYKKAE